MASNPSVQRRSKPKSRNKAPVRQPPRNSHQQQVRQIDRSASLFIHLVRLIILSLGASTIAGTAISVLNPPKPQALKQVEPTPHPQPKPSPFNTLKLTQLSLELQNRLQAVLLEENGSVTKKNSKLDASYLFVNLDTGEYSELGADRTLSAASTIKLPILIALFQDVDALKVQLDEQLTIDRQSIAEGSGDLQEQKPGSKVSVFVAATKMMTLSDNTATNLLIDRLGGSAALNQRFRSWGLAVTKINRPLPDLEGKNVTTAKELARSMMAIDRGKIVSDRSRIQILEMMSHNVRNTMLPRGLGSGANIAHKTGDIGSLIADVGSIESPTGKKYIASVLVKRSYNDPAGPELVRQMSKTAYTYFQTTPSTTTSTSTSTPNSEFKPKVDPGFPNTVFIKKKTDP
jgi:beta-lactamase class A